jgi:PST family polysaccharide transporter
LTRSGLLAVAGSAWLVNLSALITSVIRGKVSAVYLQAEGVGLIGQLNSVSLLGGSIAVLGIGTAAIQLIARHRGLMDSRSVQQLTRFVLSAPLAMSLLVTAGLCAGSPWLSTVLLADRSSWPYLCVALLSIPLNVLVGCFAIVLQAHGQAVRAASTALIAMPINTLIVVGSVITLGIHGAVASILVTSLVPAAIFLWRDRDLVRFKRRDFLLPRPLLHEVWQLGLASFVLGTASSLVDSVIRAAMVHRGAELAGQYQVLSVASNQAFMQVANGVLVYLGPGLAAAIVIDRALAKREMERGWTMLVPVMLLGALACCVLAQQLVTLLFSPDFLPATRPLRFQAVGEVLRGAAFVVGAILLPLGKRRIWLTVGLVTLAIQVLTVLVLAPKLELAAAPTGFALAWLFNFCVSLVVALRAGVAPRAATLLASLVGLVALTVVVASTPLRAGTVILGSVVCAAVALGLALRAWQLRGNPIREEGLYGNER